MSCEGGEDSLARRNIIIIITIIIIIKSHDCNNCPWCVVQEDKTALLGANECFLGVDEEDNVVAVSQKAGLEQMVVVRSNMVRLVTLRR